MKPYLEEHITITTEKSDNLLEVIKNCILLATMMPNTDIFLFHNYVEIQIYSNSNAQQLYDNWT